MLLEWLVLPKRQASESAHAHTPAQAIELSLDAWRSAEFAADQRQQLVTSGDDMRTILINQGAKSYQRKLAAVASAQNRLARLHDRWEKKARARMAEAFDHQGELPDACTARIGAVIGALLGLIPPVRDTTLCPATAGAEWVSHSRLPWQYRLEHSRLAGARLVDWLFPALPAWKERDRKSLVDLHRLCRGLASDDRPAQ